MEFSYIEELIEQVAHLPYSDRREALQLLERLMEIAESSVDNDE